jgi:hypothetical protein
MNNPSLYAIAVMNAACDYFGLTLQEMREENRKKEKRRARQIVCHLILENKNECNMTLEQIATFVGFKAHATVLHSHSTISRDKKVFIDLQKDIRNIKNLLSVYNEAPLIIAILGESGSGKTMAQDLITKEFELQKIECYTTRPPRYGCTYNHVTDTEFSALSDKLSSVLGWYPIALDAMNKADKGEQLSDAIKHYESLIDDEMRIRQQIGAIHAKYINYLDDIIDGANRRAVKNTVYTQAIRRAYP